MLAGVKVLDLTTVVLGPLCTQILADHGADVIKIEGPQGDICRFLGGQGRHPGMGPKFLHLNRNKRSVCLDLKHPEGREVLLRLAATADVMCWNTRTESMKRLGLAYEEVRKVRPDIIYCGMFGFGQAGRYADVPAYDPVVQGASGVSALMDMAFGEPRYVPYVLADRTTGLVAVQMIAMALFHRERTGEGQSIEVPMFENMATQVLTEHLYQRTFVDEDSRDRAMGDPRLVTPNYTPLKTADGFIALTANTDAQVFALFEAMGLGGLRADPRFSSVAARFEHTEDYFHIRAEGVLKRSTEFWLNFCREHDIPAAPYHTLETLLADPHLHDVGFFVRREHPTEGVIVDLAPANVNSAGCRSDWLPAPHLGEHTRATLIEAGLSQADVDRLIAAGVAAEGPRAWP